MKQLSSSNDYIWVADALPHEKPEIKKVKKSDFAKQQGFTWSEEFVFDDSVSDAEKAAFHTELDAFLKKTYNRTLAEAEDCIMLCPMGEAGYGAFSRLPIKSGLVAIYVGEYISKNKVVLAKPGFKNYTLGTPNPNITIDSFRYRNMASYFQHAFTAESPDVVFNLEPEENFAVANLRLTTIFIRGWPVMILGSTLPEIPKHKLIAYNYGYEFFNGIDPICFKANGLPYNGEKPFVACPPVLRKLREQGLQIYHLIEALKSNVRTVFEYDLIDDKQFLQCLSTLDFAIIRSVATASFNIRAEMKQADFPAKWRDFTLFVKMIQPHIKNRTEFVTRINIFTLYYEMCALLSTCEPTILKELNNRFPKQFNYFDLFHQGLANTQIILQSIILKNTGDGKMQKPSFKAFFDEGKAFWFHVKKNVPMLYDALSQEYPKYKAPVVIAENTSRAPFLNNKPLSEDDYSKMCSHLKSVCGGEWKHSFSQKRIYVQGDQKTIENIHQHLNSHKISTTKLTALPKKDKVFYFDIRDFKLDQIETLPKMAEHDLK